MELTGSWISLEQHEGKASNTLAEFTKIENDIKVKPCGCKKKRNHKMGRKLDTKLDFMRIIACQMWRNFSQTFDRDKFGGNSIFL